MHHNLRCLWGVLKFGTVSYFKKLIKPAIKTGCQWNAAVFKWGLRWVKDVLQLIPSINVSFNQFYFRSFRISYYWLFLCCQSDKWLLKRNRIRPFKCRRMRIYISIYIYACSLYFTTCFKLLLQAAAAADGFNINSLKNWNLISFV